MTAAQKQARLRFKKAAADAKKLRAKNPKLTQAQAIKQAFAIEYGKERKTRTAPKKKVGSTNIPKASKSLTDRLWDNCDSDVADQFTDAISTMIGIGRDIGFTFSQTMAAIKGNVDGVGNFYEDEF
jgi:hypothetical protein